MCGIIAYLGNKEAFPILMEGLTILQNRGYDSAGITTISKRQQLVTTKSASRETTCDSLRYLAETRQQHSGNTIGLGHSRWASHGEKTQKNSHPHHDITDRFSLVHNGVIENYLTIRKFLESHQIICSTETDTEVVVQLVYYYTTTGLNFTESFQKALSHLEGSWALVIVDRETPNKMLVARRGSPLLLGVSENQIYVASEAVAFQSYTSQTVSVNKDEMVEILYENGQINLSIDLTDRIKTANKETILMSPEPYPHWTLREINEQPFAISAALNNGLRILDGKAILAGLDSKREALLKIKNLIIVGCGTSRHAGLYIANIMRNISGFNTVQVVDASEFDSSYLNTNDIGLLALSQSGETKDVMRCLELVEDRSNVTTFSVVNSVGSQVARTTECGVYLNAGREVAVASTKAFTAQITVLSVVSVWFAQQRHRNLDQSESLLNSLNKLSECYTETLQKVDQQCQILANYLKTCSTAFILGKGLSAEIASEAALKIKEIGYLQAEGYPGGSLKHGPFALIEKGIPIMLIILNDPERSYMESTLSEVKSREAYTVVVTDIPDFNQADLNIVIPDNGWLTSLIAVLPFQLTAYYLSVLKGIDPDKPRNLAKTVTII